MDKIEHSIDEYINEVWKLNGKWHRIDGPAVIHENGTRYWCQHGQFHREDGPAVIRPNGDQWWYRRGSIHRADGPAVIRLNAAIEWWIDGQQYSFDVYCLNLDLTPEFILELKLKYE